MSHTHEVNDSDLYFVIDPSSREINSYYNKTRLMQYDHQSQRFTFEIPNKIEDHDMTLCNLIQVHYINAGSGGNKYEGIATVTDLRSNPYANDSLIFSWLVSGNATQYAGGLSFIIRFSCLTDGVVDYSWSTAVYNKVEIAKSINNSSEISEDYADVLAEWESRMQKLGKNVDHALVKVDEVCIKADAADLNATSAKKIAVKSQNDSSQALDNSEEAKATAENAMTIATQANANAELAMRSSYEKNIKTPNEMERLLVPENFGRVYKYVGDTTLMYTNGASYAVTYDETDKYFYFIEFSETSPIDNRFYFTSTEAFSVQPVNFLEESRNIEYSKDGINWTAYSGTAAISAGANEKLYFRGMNEGLQHLPPYRTFNITTGNAVACRGHIGNILNYKKIARHVNPKLVFDQFRNLFAGQTRLSSAPELPFTILYRGCYTNMFQDCENLIVAPNLPATELERECYRGMFNGCKGLTTAPELPAMVLKEDCYWNMFNGCESLTKTPELPATTLAKSCYHLMFASCIGLTSLPKLPATELPYQCYSSMFLACSSIKLATIQDETYMTPWCVPSVGTIEKAVDGWNDGMLSVTGGTFTDNPEINTTYYGAWPAETEATTA